MLGSGGEQGIGQEQGGGGGLWNGPHLGSRLLSFEGVSEARAGLPDPGGSGF